MWVTRAVGADTLALVQAVTTSARVLGSAARHRSSVLSPLAALPDWMSLGARPRWRSAAKVILATLVFAADRLSELVPRCALRNRASGVVLLYHAVPETSRDEFGAQLDRLRRWGEVVPMGDVLQEADGAWRIAITFDDALMSLKDVAIPELLAREMHATVFVPSRQLGQHPTWDGGDMYGEEIMDGDAVRSIASSLVTIGAHSRTHVRLPLISDAALTAEIGGGRADLQALTGQDVSDMAVPFGDWDERVLEACVAAGFDRVCAVDPAPVFRPDDLLVPRVTVEPYDSPWVFRLKVAGAYRWVAVWMEIKRRRSGIQARSRLTSPVATVKGTP